MARRRCGWWRRRWRRPWAAQIQIVERGARLREVARLGASIFEPLRSCRAAPKRHGEGQFSHGCPNGSEIGRRHAASARIAALVPAPRHGRVPSLGEPNDEPACMVERRLNGEWSARIDRVSVARPVGVAVCANAFRPERGDAAPRIAAAVVALPSLHVHVAGEGIAVGFEQIQLGAHAAAKARPKVVAQIAVRGPRRVGLRHRDQIYTCEATARHLAHIDGES